MLVFFFVVSFCIVHLEGSKIRHARQISRLNGQMRELDYQGWAVQARLARLCSPEQLRQRSGTMALGTLAPESVVEARGQSGERLAAGVSGLR